MRKSIKVSETTHRLIEEMRGRLPIGSFVEMLVLAHKAERPRIEAESARIEAEVLAKAPLISDADAGVEVRGVDIPPRDLLEILRDYSIEYALQYARGEHQVEPLPELRSLNTYDKLAWVLGHASEISGYYRTHCPAATYRRYIMAEKTLFRVLRVAYRLPAQNGGQR